MINKMISIYLVDLATSNSGGLNSRALLRMLWNWVKIRRRSTQLVSPKRPAAMRRACWKKFWPKYDRYNRSKIEMATEDLGSIAYIQKTLDNLDVFRFVKIFRPSDGCFGACHAGNVGWNWRKKDEGRNIELWERGWESSDRAVCFFSCLWCE